MARLALLLYLHALGLIIEDFLDILRIDLLVGQQGIDRQCDIFHAHLLRRTEFVLAAVIVFLRSIRVGAHLALETGR